jgi:SnoaL-like domain
MTDSDAVLAANTAYYEAFETADFAKMSAIWAPDDVSCIHPGWPVLIGRRAVLESYFNILGNPHQERIEHHNETLLMSGGEARVFCIEIVGGVQLAATNWFRRVDTAWRMIHHQASPIGPLAEEAAPPPAARRLN